MEKLTLQCNAKDKQDIIESEGKLQLGYVDYLNNFPDDVQDYLRNHLIQYFIPSCAVWKTNSVSTRPCWVVFDASQPTLSRLNARTCQRTSQSQHTARDYSLIHSHKVAIHTGLDIKKIYNTAILHQSNWCFQRYIWEPSLDPSTTPEEKSLMP